MSEYNTRCETGGDIGEIDVCDMNIFLTNRLFSRRKSFHARRNLRVILVIKLQLVRELVRKGMEFIHHHGERAFRMP